MSANDTRMSWDEYFMEMAKLAAKRSTCLRRNVGAVIVQDKHVVATGYNGAPKGKTKEQREFLLKKFWGIKMPVSYEAFESWAGVFKYIEVFSIILLIISAFISARIFAQEFQYRSDSVFFSTMHGRGKAIRGKIMAGFLLRGVDMFDCVLPTRNGRNIEDRKSVV